MSQSSLFMYLLVFKNPSDEQVDSIRSVFAEFDWNLGFAVEEIVANDMLNGNLLIQFASPKVFISKEEGSDELTLFPTTVEAVLTGKGQFYGALRNLGAGIENIESYFVFLGNASENRNPEDEIVYKVEYDKYSSLNKVDTSLEKLINN